MLWLQIEIESLLRNLANYHSMVEAKIDEDMASTAENLFQSEQEYDPALFEVEIDDAKWTYERYFPRFLRYSLIAMTYMILETQLIKLCDSIKAKHNLSVRAKDLKGDTLSQCRKYLEEIAHLSTKQSLWDKISDLAKVRNCIVHAMGDIELSNDRNRLRELVRTNRELLTGDTLFSDLEKNTLFVSPEYCAQSIQDVQQLLENILEAAGYKDPKASSTS